MKLLIVHGCEPSGHASAAKALEACAKARGVETVRVNISSDYHPVLGPLIARSYLFLIRRFPLLWSRLYDNPSVARPARGWQKLYLRLGARKLARRLRELAPDAVVCTSAAPLAALALAKRGLGFKWPVVAVVTDYRAHGYWLSPAADLYLVATDEAAAALVLRGAPEGSVRATGIPVDPSFSRPFDAAQARRELGLEAQGPILLVTGGSHGLGRLRAAVDAALARVPSARVLALCGDNAGLRCRLERCYQGIPAAKVYGAVPPERVRALMAASDLLIGKPGGVTVAEATAAGLPMVIFQALPGQEARNAEYLVAHGAAVQARDVHELGELLENLLKPGMLEPMRRKAAALGRPGSAASVLEAILSGTAA